MFERSYFGALKTRAKQREVPFRRRISLMVHCTALERWSSVHLDYSRASTLQEPRPTHVTTPSSEWRRVSKLVSLTTSSEGRRGSKLVSLTTSSEGRRGSKLVSLTTSSEGRRGSKLVSLTTSSEGRRGSKLVSLTTSPDPASHT